MTSTVLVASAIALVAFAHGVVILGKANRENHGSIYKIAGWFVIIASFIIMGCATIHSAVGLYRMRDSMDVRGTRMMDWFRGNGAYHHRYNDYDDNDYDNQGDRYYRRGYDEDNYRNRRSDTYNNNTDYNTTTDTSRTRR